MGEPKETPPSLLTEPQGLQKSMLHPHFWHDQVFTALRATHTPWHGTNEIAKVELRDDAVRRALRVDLVSAANMRLRRDPFSLLDGDRSWVCACCEAILTDSIHSY